MTLSDGSTNAVATVSGGETTAYAVIDCSCLNDGDLTLAVRAVSPSTWSVVAMLRLATQQLRSSAASGACGGRGSGASGQRVSRYRSGRHLAPGPQGCAWSCFGGRGCGEPDPATHTPAARRAVAWACG